MPKYPLVYAKVTESAVLDTGLTYVTQYTGLVAGMLAKDWGSVSHNVQAPVALAAINHAASSQQYHCDPF